MKRRNFFATLFGGLGVTLFGFTNSKPLIAIAKDAPPTLGGDWDIKYTVIDPADLSDDDVITIEVDQVGSQPPRTAIIRLIR